MKSSWHGSKSTTSRKNPKSPVRETPGSSNIPARLFYSATIYTLHLPASSRRETPFMTMFDAVQAPPKAA